MMIINHSDKEEVKVYFCKVSMKIHHPKDLASSIKYPHCRKNSALDIMQLHALIGWMTVNHSPGVLGPIYGLLAPQYCFRQLFL